MSFSPTIEQVAIRDAALQQTAPLMLTAFAGCAKTTTLELLASAITPQPTLALAFNARIKKELEKRFPPHFQVKTLNGLGHGAWSSLISKRLTVNDRKLGECINAAASAAGLELTPDQWTEQRSLVSRAQQVGLVPKGFPSGNGLVPDNEDSWQDIADYCWIDGNIEAKLELARQALILSIKQAFAGVITFDDQIYMSALFGGIFPRFNLVMVDESQDLSPINHIMVKKSSAGRIIAVGDPKQAIYQFRGADSQSMTSLRKIRPSGWTDLPLATTFRCPQAIVSRQQSHAPGFTAWHTNPEGQVFEWQDQSWTWPRLTSLPEVNNTNIAVLCRNNSPLLSLAFKLIRQSIGVVMLGRDIGKGLVTLAKKIISDPNASPETCQKLIEGWRTTQLLLAENRESKIAGIHDRAGCLLAVLEGTGVRSCKDLVLTLDDLFSREHGQVTLASGHRSKGFEWNTVIHLDPWRIPSKFAERAALEGDMSQMEQEHNLRYVIETRAKHTLVNANLEDFT